MSREPSPAPLWSPDFAQFPPSRQQPEVLGETSLVESPMSQYAGQAAGKTSSDSGQTSALDRFSQRRLQRLNTEQVFREQRQGGGPQQGGVLSPPGSLGEQSGYNSNSYSTGEAQPQPQAYHQQSQPHAGQQGTAYQSSRTSHSNNSGLAIQTHSVSSNSRSPNFISQETASQQQNLQYSPPDAAASYLSEDPSRPHMSSSRSYSGSQQHHSSSGAGAEEASMSSSNHGSVPVPAALRAQQQPRSGNSNRQSMHNGLNSREGSGVGASGSNGGQQAPAAAPASGGMPAFNASVVPAGSQGQPSAQQAQQNSQAKSGDVGRVTPQPQQSGENMSEEDINQLIKDHRELRGYHLLYCSANVLADLST